MTEEKELVGRLSAGDPDAFRELVETYKKKMFFLALDLVGDAADAEDISQEAFLKAWHGFKTFKRDSRLSSWLYRIAYNTSVDHLRRRPLSPETVEDAVRDTGSGGFKQGVESRAVFLKTNLSEMGGDLSVPGREPAPEGPPSSKMKT